MTDINKKLGWLPAVLLMLGIFYFSSQPATVSGTLSGGIAYRLVSLAEEMTGQEWGEEKKLEISRQIDFPIRKLAHLTEYALLGVALANWRRRYVFTQLVGSLYAASDEIHQLFVPGRAGRIGDVLIDSVGVLLGWGVFIVIMRIIGRKKGS